MQHTDFIGHRASVTEQAIAWSPVVLFIAATALALRRWARWPWIASAPAAVAAYVVFALVLIYGRLWLSWRG